MADIIAVSLVLLFVRVTPRSIPSSSSLQMHLLSTVFAAFMWSSIAGSGLNAGVVARGLANRALEALGEYSLTIYLLQWPVYLMLSLAPQIVPMGRTLSGGMWSLVILLAMSMALTELVEKPLANRLVQLLLACCQERSRDISL